MRTQRQILVVEDDPVMRDIILLVFTQQFQPEIQILTAENGFVALETIQRSRPDLVILDILLPQMNGLQMIQKMHEEKSLQETPIIIVTGLGFREIVQQAQELGVNDFLVKPFKPEILVERAKSLLKFSEPAIA